MLLVHVWSDNFTIFKSNFWRIFVIGPYCGVAVGVHGAVVAVAPADGGVAVVVAQNSFFHDSAPVFGRFWRSLGKPTAGWGIGFF